MHDFAMPVDTGVENRKTTLTSPKQTAQSDVLTTAHVGALTTCLTSVHRIFDIFLILEVQKVRSLPIFQFARLARASVLLIRMYFAAITPDSELGKVISSDDMKVEQYIRGLIDLLRSAARDGKCDPAYKLSIVLAMMQVQFERSKEGKTGLVDEIVVDSTLEARPVDTEKYSKSGYKKMQLEGSRNGSGGTSTSSSRSHPVQPSPPKERMPPPPAPAPAPAPPAFGDRALQVLSEVAMTNPPAASVATTINGHHHHDQSQNGSEGWYGAYSTHSAAAVAVSIYSPEFYSSPHHAPHSASMGDGSGHGGLAGVHDDHDPTSSFHEGMLNGMHMHPAFEQAISMTLGAGDLNILDDDGFYQIMQDGAGLFGGGGGG